MAELKQQPSPSVPEAAPATSSLPQDPAGAGSSILEQTRILALLYDLSKEFTSILDFDALLHTVGERIKQLVDYDVFNVMLLNEETQRLEHVLSIQYDQRIEIQTTLALGQGLCGTAALERKSVRVNQARDDPRYIECVGAPQIASELVVPLIAKDRLLGVLDLESLRTDAFTPENEQMLATLAASVAIALENARLYNQLRRAEQRKSEDLERARELQQMLLPAEMPALPGLDVAVLYLPAQELGGDFYDFLKYKDGCTAIAIGDVAGKGSAAALLASLGVGILREHVTHAHCQPAELLADLNGHLQIPGQSGRFIAMAFAVYEPSRRELWLSNAGFPRPLLVREGRAEMIDIRGVPLGLLPDTQYDSKRLRLEPGDLVVFCSDGIHEQTNALEEEFGLERLISRLAGVCASSSAKKIAADIVRAIEDHAGFRTACCGFNDDRTIMVLRVTGAA